LGTPHYNPRKRVFFSCFFDKITCFHMAVFRCIFGTSRALIHIGSPRVTATELNNLTYMLPCLLRRSSGQAIRHHIFFSVHGLRTSELRNRNNHLVRGHNDLKICRIGTVMNVSPSSCTRRFRQSLTCRSIREK
jgi:hypothetical protein